MLDMVAGTFSESPTLNQLKDWVSNPFIPPHGNESKKYFQTFKVNGVVIKFTHYPPNPGYPRPQTRIEFSPSTLLFGNNVQLIENQSQIEEAINLANKYLSTISWIPPVDIGDGILFRIDATYNHPVGARVHDYIRALFNLEVDYPQRETRPWKYCGVQFYSKATTTTFYDLWSKHRIPSAIGMLRQETSMRGSRNIAAHMGIDNPTLRRLSLNWLTSVLEKDLKVLHLDNAIICTRDLAQEILLNKYRVNKGIKLYGYLIARQSLTRKEMLLKGGSERTIHNWDDDLDTAGVALTMTEKVGLPPLCIDAKVQKSAGGTQ